MIISLERLESVLLTRQISMKELEDNCLNGISLRAIIRDGEIPANVMGRIASYTNCDQDYLSMKKDSWISDITAGIPMLAFPAEISTATRQRHVVRQNAPSGRKMVNFDFDRLTERRLATGFSKANLSKLTESDKFLDAIYRGSIKSVKKENLARMLYLLQADLDYLEGKSDIIDKSKIPALRELDIPSDWVYFEKLDRRLHNFEITDITEYAKISYSYFNRINYGRLYCPLSIAKSIKRRIRKFNKDIDFFQQQENIEVASEEENIEGYPIILPEAVQETNSSINFNNILMKLSIEQIDGLVELCEKIKMLKEAEKYINEHQIDITI